MATSPQVSAFRVEKIRSHATVTLSSGEALVGCFFLSHSSAHLPGPECVGELLNAETGFFPFEVHDRGAPRTVLLNRAHLLTVTLADNEARRVAGYEVATRHFVAIGLSTGRRLTGAVRVYRPDGQDRLSDWARHPEQFQYIECDHVTLLVNMAHVIEVSEAPHA